MARLLQAYIHIRHRAIAQEELEEIAEVAYSIAQIIAQERIPIPDLDFHVRVEEGSLRSRTTIGATLAAIYFGMALLHGPEIRYISTR